MHRIQSVDVIRVVAIIAVIVIHVVPFTDQPNRIGGEWNAATVVNQLARFAVPFFFIVSGYLWAQKIEDERNVYPLTARMAKRILLLFAVWCAIYLLPMDVVSTFEIGQFGWVRQCYRNIREIFRSPFITVFEGTKWHLWFLPALLCALIITAFLVRHRQQRLLVVLAILLYAVGLAGKAYSNTPLVFTRD